VAWVERDGGVRLYWEARGDGPGVLVAHSYIQHPDVFGGLLDELATDHRVIRYDARGCGRSSPEGPYDMGTDVADLVAVAEAVGPLAVILANGDAANRGVHAAAARPDLLPVVIALESLPLSPGDASDTDTLISSGGVLEALIAMMRADYRSGVMAAVQRGNPDMSADETRDRVDRTVAYTPHDAGLARLEEWIRDAARDDARALGDRLVVAYEGAGGWFPAELHDRAAQILPDARFERLEGGAISRPGLTADVVRSVVAAARR
jgi:pimeloyl-ACP methyl ester carboxylesterase